MMLRYYLFFQCPLLHKNALSWLVCMVSACVWMVSGLCLRVSENVSIQNILTNFYILPFRYSDIGFYSSALKGIKPPISAGVCVVSGGVWGCLDGVWMVSGLCLTYVLGAYMSDRLKTVEQES